MLYYQWLSCQSWSLACLMEALGNINTRKIQHLNDRMLSLPQTNEAGDVTHLMPQQGLNVWIYAAAFLFHTLWCLDIKPTESFGAFFSFILTSAVLFAPMNAIPCFFSFHVKLKLCVIADRRIHSHVCEIAHLRAIVLHLVSMETNTITCELLFIYFIYFLPFSVKVRTQSHHHPHDSFVRAMRAPTAVIVIFNRHHDKKPSIY